jgi:hypothetical protein
MEFMDLPSYVDSFRQGYDAAYGDLMARMQQMAPGATGSAATWSPPAQTGPTWQGRRYEYQRERRDHREHHRHEWRERCHSCGCECDCDDDCRCRCHHDRHPHDCDGCRHHRHDCRCECCIVDADVVVFARSGELRVIPIEVTNDTRKVRENVDVDVSDVRSSGGNVLPWEAIARPGGPLTLEPCSTTKLELIVHITCQRDAVQPKAASTRGARDTVRETAKEAKEIERLADLRELCPDVDRCEVGYITVRLAGCLIRPIVVAIAVLPRDCDVYRAGCACTCCC